MKMKTGNMHDNIQQTRKILIRDENASESVKNSLYSQDTMQKTCFGEINCMILKLIFIYLVEVK